MSMGEISFAEQLHQRLKGLLTSEQAEEYPDHSTRGFRYLIEDPNYGQLKITDYWNRGHKDPAMSDDDPDRDRSYMLSDVSEPILYLEVPEEDVYYFAFRPDDVNGDPETGSMYGSMIMTGVSEDTTETDFLVKKGVSEILEHPEEDPILRLIV